MESSTDICAEVVNSTDPESEEVDETFYMNRLLMLGTTVSSFSTSPYRNAVSSSESGISPLRGVLPRSAQMRPLDNDQIHGNQAITSVSQGHAGTGQDGANSSNVDSMTEGVGPVNTSLTPKRCRTQIKSRQNTRPLRRSLRTSRKPDTYKSEIKTKCMKKNIKGMRGRERPPCKNISQKGNKPKKRDSLSHPSTGGQQRPREELYSNPGLCGIAIKHPKTGNVLRVDTIQRRLRFGETMLHIAVIHEDIQSLEELIKVGFCVNATDNAGWTPLHEAVLCNNVPTVEILLRAGAQVNHTGYNGITPLHDAAKIGNLKIIDLLLKHGADPLLKNTMGKAAIDIKENISVQKLLGKYVPTAKRKCLPACSVSCTSCAESGNKKLCSKTGVGQYVQGAEKAHTSSTETGASPKVMSSVPSVFPQRHQTAGSSTHGSLMVEDQDTVGSDTFSSTASDAESDITVDYIEAHSSSPGHWFLSATQDFSGSIIRVVGETVRKDVNALDGGLYVNQGLNPASNKSKPSHSKGFSRDSSSNLLKRSLKDVSTNGHETVTRKKIRRITASSKANSFLEYLLNFDLNRVSVTNRSVPKDNHSDRDVPRAEAFCEDTHTSHTQGNSRECSVSGFASNLAKICEPNSSHRIPSVVHTLRQPLQTVTQSLVPREEFPESTENGSPSLLIGIVHDHGLTSSSEPWAEEKMFGQLTKSGEELKILHSDIQSSSNTVSRSSFDERRQKQKSLPLSNLTIDSITMENPSEWSQTNIDTQNNLTSKELLEISEETIISTVMNFEKHQCQSDKPDIPTKLIQRREVNRETQLSCSQAYDFLTNIDGIINSEHAGDRSRVKIVETPSTGILKFEASSADKISPECLPKVNSNENKNTNRDNSVPGISLVFTCGKGGNEDVEEDCTRCSTDSDCTVIDELELLKKSDKDGEDGIIPAGSTCDKEQHIKQHSLCRRALDERTIGEDLENTVDPLDTGNSVSMLRHLQLRPSGLLPALDNKQGKANVQKDDFYIVEENKEMKMGTKKQQKDKFMRNTQTNKANAATKQDLMITPRMLHSINEVGETYLHRACRKGDLLLVKRLIKAGININISDNAGWTPLHEAITAGYVDVVDQLLCAGADVNRTGLAGVTPLHDAVSCGHYEVVKLLLHYGSNPHDQNGFGKTALDLADHESIRELLLTFKGPLVKPIRQTESTKQGSQILTREQRLDSHGCDPQTSSFCQKDVVETHRKKNPGSSAAYKDTSSNHQTLEEVEKKQREMSSWELREPEDGSRFTDALLKMQTVLNNVLFNQKAKMFHQSDKCRITDSDSFHEGKLNENILDAPHQKLLHMLLQKQEELKHKLQMFIDQTCSSLTGETELSLTEHGQVYTDNDYISTNIPSQLKSQSVISNVASPSLISERTAAINDRRTLSSLIRKGVIQPGENALELTLMGSCHKASLLHDGSLRDSGGKVFSIPELWVSSVLGNTIPVSTDFAWKKVTYGSKPLWDCSSAADSNTGNGSQRHQELASKAICTGFPVEESLTKVFVAISSIHLIRDEEFLPCYQMERYWNLFIQSEDWDI